MAIDQRSLKAFFHALFQLIETSIMTLNEKEPILKLTNLPSLTSLYAMVIRPLLTKGNLLLVL